MAEALRWIIGAFILLNAIWGTVAAIRVARLKRAVGRTTGPRPVDPVLESLSWPLVVLWLSALVLFVASAVLLILARAATVVAFLAAFLLDAIVFWRAQRRAAGAAFGARQRLTRHVLFGLLAVASLGGQPLPGPYSSAPPDGVHLDGGRRGSLRPVA
ncbi:MAG TPA: hypothetical protein VGK26_10625 [Thermoanaerobaculia bacterium]|jgi:hypothetical protein